MTFPTGNVLQLSVLAASPVQRVLFVFTLALVLWLWKPIPYTVSSLLCASLLYALGLTASLGRAFQGFASPLVMFLLVLFLLGDAISNVGLDEWLATRLLARVEDSRGAFRALALAVFGTALVMPSATARATTFAPIVDRLAATLGVRDDRLGQAGFALLGHANPVASMALMTGGGMALVTAQIVGNTVRPLSWLEWAVAMGPPVAVLYVLVVLCLGRIHVLEGAGPRRGSDTEGPAVNSIDPDDGTVPMTDDQRTVALVLLGTLLAWAAGSVFGVPALYPGVLAVTILTLPGVGVLSSADVRSVNWGILFLIATTLSILSVMEETGAVVAMISSVTGAIPLATLPYWQVVAFFLTLVIVVRVGFSTGTAAIVVVLPVVLEFSARLNVNRLYMALSVLLVVGSTTVVPFNTTAVLVAMDRGPITESDVLQYGGLTMGCSLLVVATAWRYYWPLVL